MGKGFEERAFGQQYGSRDARDNFSAVMQTAARGDLAVVRREQPVVLVRRDVYDAVLANAAPFNVLSSVREGQVTFWLDSVPVHGSGPSLEDAEDDFLDALIDYADLWTKELRHAPNHQGNGELVRRVAMYAEDRDELRRVVFD
ncbi:MAG: hypothetical protein ACYDC5_12490 [Candidatus Dormibacteria bacterium]